MNSRTQPCPGKLVLIVALTLTVTFGINPQSADAEDSPVPLSRYQQMARDTLEQLVEINTTDSVGDNTVAAEAMAARSRLL